MIKFFSNENNGSACANVVHREYEATIQNHRIIKLPQGETMQLTNQQSAPLLSLPAPATADLPPKPGTTSITLLRKTPGYPSEPAFASPISCAASAERSAYQHQQRHLCRPVQRCARRPIPNFRKRSNAPFPGSRWQNSTPVVLWRKSAL
jgi:hypothetical protein